MVNQKTKKTCKFGHTFYKSSDCPSCPTCEKLKAPASGFLAILCNPARNTLLHHVPDGIIMHAEVQIDDSVIMLSNSSEKYPPVTLMMHVYVSDVDQIFQTAIAAGCEVVQPPKDNEGDPDRRGTFKDFAGNMWSVGTQLGKN